MAFAHDFQRRLAERGIHVTLDTSVPLREQLVCLEDAALAQLDQFQQQLLRNARADDLQLRCFIEEAPVAIAMFDRDMRYLAVSRRWIADYGLQGQEIIGRTHYEVFPEVPERWKRIHQQALTGEVMQATEDCFVRQDGTSQWLRWEIRPWYESDNTVGGIIMFTEDITAYKKSIEQYRTIVETAQEGIWVLDRDLRATYANVRLAEMLGYTVSEIIGRSPYDFIASDRHEQMQRHFEQRKHGNAEIYEFPFRRRDGSELWALVSGTPLCDEQGQFTGTFGMLTDVTERHQAVNYQREFARRTIEAATEGKLLVSDRADILQTAGDALASWNIHEVADLKRIRHAISEMARTGGMPEDRIDDFLLCISEAATNAYKHAGGGSLSLHHFDDSLMAVIVDHGPGIPAVNLPEVALKRGYTTAQSLGMGYKAMITIADRVYLATSPEGTTVGIVMAVHPHGEPEIAIDNLLELWKDR